MSGEEASDLLNTEKQGNHDSNQYRYIQQNQLNEINHRAQMFLTPKF